MNDKMNNITITEIWQNSHTMWQSALFGPPYFATCSLVE